MSAFTAHKELFWIRNYLVTPFIPLKKSNSLLISKTRCRTFSIPFGRIGLLNVQYQRCYCKKQLLQKGYNTNINVHF